MRKKKIAALLAALLMLCGCGREREPAETVDPYAGMVQVESGYGVKIWVREQEGVPVSGFRAEDFGEGGVYLGTDRRAVPGIDVSEHQGEIDWAAVAADGVEFAIIRAGYRGYGEAGTLREDQWFRANMDGALAAGIPVGVYFFSQALNAEEAAEEAAFLLELLEPYGPDALALPVYFDWEDITHDTARTNGLDGETITDCALAFTEAVAAAGYTAGVYAYRYLGYFQYDLARLAGLSLWIGAVGDWPDFYYAHDVWQYSTEGSVAGIEGNVDLDFRFEPLTPEVQETPEAQENAAATE